MYSPQYLRHRQSLATTDDGSLRGRDHSAADELDDEAKEGSAEQREKNEEELRLAGLRRRSLLLLFLWLGLISFMALLLLILHLSLVLVLQMSPRGMRGLRIFTYEDTQTGRDEPAVHFSADRVNLGQVVAKSGKVLGPRSEQLQILGSRVLIGAGNGTRAVFQEDQCRLEAADQFQIRQPASGKVLFSARHPLVGIDKRIKRISSGLTVTNKLRAPVDSSMHISGQDLGLRGNERIQMEARRLNVTAGTGIRLATSEDGSVRISGRHIFLGGKWLSLPLSPTPALIASVDAFRVCLCRSSRGSERSKLFLVPGNRACNAPATICQ